MKVLQQKFSGTFFEVGDMVLKWKTSQDGVHKLATPWEGPYIIKAIT
jgi:hypothetical protein